MTARELEKQIELADEGLLTTPQMVALIRELAVYRQMALRLERAVHDLVKEAEKHEPAL